MLATFFFKQHKAMVSFFSLSPLSSTNQMESCFHVFLYIACFSFLFFDSHKDICLSVVVVVVVVVVMVVMGGSRINENYHSYPRK